MTDRQSRYRILLVLRLKFRCLTAVPMQRIEHNAQNNQILPLRIIFFVCLLATAGYFEIAAVCAGAAVSIWLLFRLKKNNLYIRLNDTTIAIYAISFFYFLTIIWAVDRGTAFWGAAKFLSLSVIVTAILQLDRQNRAVLLADIPLSGALITILSIILQFIEPLKPELIINGRLAGSFLYPNTFAVFLLTGIIICLMEPDAVNNSFPLRRINMPRLFLVILGIGFVAAGSRAAIVIGIIMICICLIVLIRQKRDKKVIIFGIAMLFAGIAAGILIVLLLKLSSAGHLVYGSNSTILGRIIYAQDALKKIIRNPFGLGYLGYFFTQGSFQSMAYSVRWAHNDLLQLALDIGWIPAILMVIAVVKSFFVKNTPAVHRVIIGALVLHGLMDFDFQFISMWIVLLLVMDLDSGYKTITFKGRHFPVVCISVVVVSLACLYAGTAAFLAEEHYYKAAEKIFPNTFSEIDYLTEAKTAEEMDYYSGMIIGRNENVSIAWQARAEAGFGRGDFRTVIDSSHKAIELNPYDESLYTAYNRKLTEGIIFFRQASDEDSVIILEEELKWASEYQTEVIQRSNPLTKYFE